MLRVTEDMHRALGLAASMLSATAASVPSATIASQIYRGRWAWQPARRSAFVQHVLDAHLVWVRCVFDMYLSMRLGQAFVRKYDQSALLIINYYHYLGSMTSRHYCAIPPRMQLASVSRSDRAARRCLHPRSMVRKRTRAPLTPRVALPQMFCLPPDAGH